MYRKQMTRTVLIIDDNPAVGDALSLALSLHEIRPLTALTPDEGLAMLDREAIDVVIQDMNFTADTTSGEEGVALFRAIRERHPDLPVILLTAWTHLETAPRITSQNPGTTASCWPRWRTCWSCQNPVAR
jgi:DNA-binding NtrC family response regulator